MERDSLRPVLTVSEMARLYALSPNTLRSAIAAGDLPAFRLGKRRVRVLREDLHEWMRSHAVSGTERGA